MKLKRAKYLAKLLKYNYIAVDRKSKEIWAYTLPPYCSHAKGVFVDYGGGCKLLGFYTGKKNWKETLSEIHYVKN